MRSRNLTRLPWLRAMVTLSGVFLLLCLGGCQGSEGQAEEDKRPQPASIPVEIEVVRPAPMRDILTLPGETEAFKDVRVASETGGRVEWIGPREGAAVRQGELLAKIDVSSLKAELQRAEASFRLADELYQRRARLFSRKIITQEEMDRSLTERTLAKSRLEQARIEYERGFLKAPIAGRINDLHVEEGEFVNRGNPVADIVDVSRIKITVNVSERDVPFIRKGQKVQVSIDALPGVRLKGVVDFVAYRAEAATRTFPVRVVVPNPREEIRPGMIARVSFVRRMVPEALSVPLFAVVDKGGERLVFVEEEGHARARTISVGIIEGDRVQVTRGLKAGDRVIITGQTQVEEGSRVRTP